MPDRIYVTYTPTTAPGTFHTAIHYERADSTGKLVRHVVIQAGPENEESAAEASGVIEEPFRSGNSLSDLGRIKAKVDGPSPSDDPNAPFETIHEGEDLSPNLERMQSYADEVNAAGYPYGGYHQNSNSFASGALRAGALPAATGMGHDPAGPAGELLEYFTPGLNETLKDPTYNPVNVERASPFKIGAGPVRFLSSRTVSPPDQGSLDNRFGNWTSSGAGSTPLNPNLPVPPPEAGRPLGIFSGKPMPLWITPPPLGGLGSGSRRGGR